MGAQGNRDGPGTASSPFALIIRFSRGQDHTRLISFDVSYRRSSKIGSKQCASPGNIYGLALVRGTLSCAFSPSESVERR